MCARRDTHSVASYGGYWRAVCSNPRTVHDHQLTYKRACVRYPTCLSDALEDNACRLLLSLPRPDLCRLIITLSGIWLVSSWPMKHQLPLLVSVDKSRMHVSTTMTPKRRLDADRRSGENGNATFPHLDVKIEFTSLGSQVV